VFVHNAIDCPVWRWTRKINCDWRRRDAATNQIEIALRSLSRPLMLVLVKGGVYVLGFGVVDRAPFIGVEAL